MRPWARAVATLLGALGVAGCEPPKAAETPKAQPPAKVDKVAKEDQLGTIVLTPEAEQRLGITTAEAERKEVGRTRTYAGDVLVPPGRLISVTAPFIGTLLAPKEERMPTPGTEVRKGQPILSLLPLLSPEARATLATSRVDAEGQVEQAKKQLGVAKLNLDRIEGLRREKTVGIGALEDAKAQHEIARTALRNAEDRRDILAKTIREAEGGSMVPMPLPAPEDGLLRNVQALAGQQVAAGAVLFEVERLDPVWVRVPVYVGDRRLIAADQPADVGDLADAPGTPRVAAKPVVAPPSGDALAATVDLFYEVPNPDHLLSPGQKVGVTLTLKGDRVGLVVPKPAVYYDLQGGTWLYEQVKDHTYARRRIEVDRIVGDQAVLTRGPKPGTKVVTLGVAELYGTEFGFAK
jgi:RND family efflux transporter MFP subunit